MSLFLGLDTSNYTTSAAVYDAVSGNVAQAKQLLPVKEGERGIRQSDAVFHHTRQLPDVLSRALSSAGPPDFAGIGVSTRPRRVEGSYMPCFWVGTSQAQVLSEVLGIPVYEFSHQEGHLAAALYSAGRLDLTGQEFLAFHVSGGTTESLLAGPGKESPVEATLAGTSTDLKAGQAIDRIGVALGLPFPCGPALEQLALQSDRIFRVHPSLNGLDCSLSGVENQCRKMMADGEPDADVALYCLKAVGAALAGMAKALLNEYPGRPLVFSGGVMSNSILKEDLKQKFDCCFAEPAFSADNAAGVAVLAYLQDRRAQQNG